MIKNMKITKYLMLLAAATGLVAACQKQEMVMVDMSKAIAPVMHDIDSAGVKNQIIIKAENQTAKVTFTWDAADFNVNTQVDYSVEVAVGDGPKAVILSGITKTEGQQTYEAINQTLYNTLGLKENVLTDVNFYVGATVGAAQTLYSAPVVVKVSVTAAEKQYPKMTIVGSYQGWKPGQPQYVYDFAGDDAMYQGLIDFGANGYDYTKTEFKITGTDWGADNGEHSAPEGAEIEAEAAEIDLVSGGGSNITAYRTHRFYHFTFDKKAPKLVKNQAFNTIGIVGTAVGSWDTDVDMNFDVATQKFWADVTLAAGEMKFRADDAWDVNWGVDEAAAANEMKKGVLNGGSNIKVPAGNYRVFLNLNNADEPSFELNADKYGEESTQKPEPEKPGPSGETVTKYFVPAADWTGEGITFAAWIWATGGDGSWYDVVDSDADGVYEVTFPKELDNIIFTSMNGDADWANKINQTGDLKIPADGTNAYDGATGTWYVFGGAPATDITVYFKPDSNWTGEGITFAAWVWATGGDGSWYDVVDSDADGVYEVTFPKELDNIIFASMNGATDWGNKVQQTTDLKVPADGKNIYDTASGAWVGSDDEGGATPPSEGTASEWGIIGVAGNWSTNVVMYEEGEWIVARGVTFSDNNEFKFRKGNAWGTELVYEGTVTVDAEYACAAGGGNSKLVQGGTYDVYLAASLDKFYIMTQGKTPADAGDAVVTYIDPSDASFVVGLSGSAIGWDDPSFDTNDRASFKSKEVTDAEKFAGTYTFELTGLDVAVDDKFKVRVNGAWIGKDGAVVEGIELGEPDGDGNFVAAEAGTYKVTITFAWDGTAHSDVKAVFSK